MRKKNECLWRAVVTPVLPWMTAFAMVLGGCAAEIGSSVGDDAAGDDTVHGDAVGVDASADSSAATVEALLSDSPREAGEHSVTFREEVVIDADATTVWNILVDLPGYEDWNPWVVWTDATDFAEAGDDVNVDVVMGRKTMRAAHRVLVVEAERRFCWRDAGWNAAFVYGQRCRWLTARDDGTVLFQQEVLIDGALAQVASLFYGAALRSGMATETAALKDYAEALEGR